MGRSFFSWDGPLIRFFGTAGKLIILSFVWLVTCVPIVTVGLSTTALYYTVVKVVRRDNGYLLREFFGAMRREWKQGLLFSVMYILLYIILYFDYLLWTEKVSVVGLLSGIVCIVLIVIVTMSACYLFPLISRFELSIGDAVKTAFFLTFRYLPSSVAMFLMVAISAELISSSGYFVLFLPGFATMGISVFVERIFKGMIPEPEMGERQWFDGEDKEEEDAE